MGFFNKPETGASGTLEPLSKDRIKAALEAKGWSYSVDADGDIGGGWSAGTFWFLASGREGEVLQVRGVWRGELPGEQFARAGDVCIDWNMRTLWPKTYPRVHEETGAVKLFGEVSVDYEHGVTDEQLGQHLSCALETTHEFFAKLAEAFPEAAPADDEE